MAIYRFVVRFNRMDDPRSMGLLTDAHALGFEQLQLITCRDLYFIEGQLSTEECKRLALELLTDPVAQTAEWSELSATSTDPAAEPVIVEVALRPGVTDPVADEIVRAAHELGIQGIQRASTGFRYLLYFNKSVPIRESVTESVDKSVPIRESATESVDKSVPIRESVTESVAQRLLANAVIHRWAIGEIEPSFPGEAVSSGEVETIRVLCDDEGLLAISKERRAALDLAEMQAIRAYCEREGRNLTDIEFEAIAQTWSEHCGHKTFKAKIQVIREQVIRIQGQDPNPLLPDSFSSFLDFSRQP